MQKSLVYSYSRFSDTKQASGSSLGRQQEYAQRWAAEHGMTLDSALSLRDEGLSAYHQRHVKHGALGTFLRAVEDGLIPSGSVLIVEGLDRLSRAEPIQAQAQLAQIINAGITVVTASDGREYNRTSLKAQPMDLVYSLLVMIRAYEESDTKSKRVRAAVRRQCESWQKGNWRGVIRSGKDPQWVELINGKFELHPERSTAIRFAVNCFMKGYGAVSTIRMLTENELSMTKSGNPAQQIYRMVRNRALIGEKVIEVDGLEYRLSGYYPPLLTNEQFSTLQEQVSGRAQRKGKGEIPGILTGIGVTFCGYCGTAMVAQNLMQRRSADGSLHPGYRRVVCVGYSQNAGCPVGGTFSVAPFENAVMQYCSDQINLTSLMAGNAVIDISQRALAHRTRLAEIDTQLERLTNALLHDDASAPAFLVRKMRELEENKEQERAQLDVVERELILAGSDNIPAAEAWSAIATKAMDLDSEARMEARRLVAESFQRIVIYHRGFIPAKKERHIDLVLIGKHGSSRLLRIHRRTGQWVAMEDIQSSSADISLIS